VADPLYFLRGESLAAAQILAFDWSQTDLGPPEKWPSALKTAVSIMLASHFPKAIVWGPGMLTIHNDAFRPILGRKPLAIGRSFRDVWAETWDGISDIVARAFNGEATFIENFPLVINRHGYDEEAHFTFCYSPIRDENGDVAGMMDTVIEVSQTVATQRRMAVVNGELAHRMKNMVTVIGAIASQTLRNANDLSEAQLALQQRLTALGHAQQLLTNSNVGTVKVRDISSFALEAVSVDPDQIDIDGPDMWLAEKQALSLALVINELATNSFKYGALSLRSGKVSIAWEVSGVDEEFSFLWKESGGPPAEPPARKGFGTTLLERVAPLDFHGTADLFYGAEGFRYDLRTSRKALAG